MQLSVFSGKNGLIQRATWLAFGDSTTHVTAWPLADIVVSLNRWVHRVSTWIWQASGTWEFDDTNQADLPVATTTLVNNQQDYALPATTFKILRVQINDSGGNWTKLDPIDQSEVGSALDEYYETAGIPKKYDIIGNSVFLYPKPDTAQVTASAGLKIWLAREATEFSAPASYTTADTTQPGFDEPFHDIIILGAAYDWCITNGPEDRAKRYREEIELLKQDLFKHIGDKARDKKIRIQPKLTSFR